MPTQKVFKRRVRARMTKTGESYTAARSQLLRKATDPVADPAPTAQPDLLTSDEAVRRATGQDHDHWFRVLDDWGATQHNHTRIAGHLRDDLGLPGWWAQNITVAYERVRGMRGRHQQADGFSIGVTRTVNVPAERALGAFTDAALRRRWLPEVRLRQRPTTAARTARFDWPDPASRLVVNVDPKGDAKTTVAIAHEKLPDLEAAEREKAAWRERLARLKTVLES